MSYDSKGDTLEHIGAVRVYIDSIIISLMHRARWHDQSKLEEPEKSVFDEWTPKLKSVTYGSAEYRSMLDKMRPAINHHQRHNRHHPEYHGEMGVGGMDLVDLVEMICDWKAATMRHDDGDIRRSLIINKDRFGMDPAIVRLLENTINGMGW